MSTAATAASEDRGLRPLGRAGLHLIALSSLAFAQPLLDVLGRYPAFFAAHDVTRWGVVVFALVVLLGPGLVLLAVEALATLVNRRAGWIVHLVFIGGLGAVFALTLVRRLGWAPAPDLRVERRAGRGARGRLLARRGAALDLHGARARPAPVRLPLPLHVERLEPRHVGRHARVGRARHARARRSCS